MGFDGRRVLALESRRANEIATLIRKQGGKPFVAPSMREIQNEQNDEAIEFGRRLLGGEFDGVILLTGVGTRMLWKALLSSFSEEDLKTALARVTIIVRGPKPSAAVREIGLSSQVQVPEPNTWREILEVMKSRPEIRLALQEYGKPNTALIEGLQAQGRTVTRVPVYGWDLPLDTSPLREAAVRIAERDFDVVLLTTSLQLVNLMKIATEAGIEKDVLEGLRDAKIGSIGPTTSETIEDYGLKAVFEPSHPKMGLLVNEFANTFNK